MIAFIPICLLLLSANGVTAPGGYEVSGMVREVRQGQV